MKYPLDKTNYSRDETFMPMIIAILEDNPERRRAMQASAGDRLYTFETRCFQNPKDILDFLDGHLEETIAISLDHDMELTIERDGLLSDPGTGRDVADFLATKAPTCPVIIHSTNSSAALGMERVLRDADWTTIRVAPWGDLEWIEAEWVKALRNAIVANAKERVKQ